MAFPSWHMRFDIGNEDTPKAASKWPASPVASHFKLTFRAAIFILPIDLHRTQTKDMMNKLEQREWFRDWFDKDYLTLYAHRDVEEAHGFVVQLWRALELRAGALVADVPCGSGRHCASFARLGARVVGVDLSGVMLRAAVLNTLETDGNPCFIRADLRRLPLACCFQVVTNLFTSFGYFESEADNSAAFAGLARILAPGGVLVLDTLNPSYLEQHFHPESHYETDAGRVTETRELDAAAQRVNKTIRLQKGRKQREIRESIRLYNREDLTTLAEEHGLTPIEFWGDYGGGTFALDSPRLILMAKK
jgi:SAM-dependent methyltransferase